MVFPWKCLVICITIFHVLNSVECEEYSVRIENDSPVVIGATIRFTASLYHGNKPAFGESFAYYWNDNAIPAHSYEVISDHPVVTWYVEYDHTYPPGLYEVQVIVKRIFIIYYYSVTSNRSNFKLSATLNGNLQIDQKNKTRLNKFVSTSSPAITSVSLSKEDGIYISNATAVTTYWFIDCIYYGPSNNAQFSHVFSTSDEEHRIDALMVADFYPPPPTTTTTVKPTTSITTIKPNETTAVTKIPSKFTTSISSLSMSKSNEKGAPKVRSTLQQVVNNTELKRTQNIRININGTLQQFNGSFPYICNGTVAVDQVNAYGYFSKKIVTRDPISSVNITGNNWLQHGDMLALVVTCNGSPSLRYCVKFYRGSYNATGNESCYTYLTLGNCNFLIQRYLGDADEHTVLLILENDVTKFVKTVAVTIYEVKKQAQLSVIVVPVAFSLISVVAVVFGLAYYIQNRERFIVEVADFNFGAEYSELEYKTFRERLQESLMIAFTRAPTQEASEAPNWSSD